MVEWWLRDEWSTITHPLAMWLRDGWSLVVASPAMTTTTTTPTGVTTTRLVSADDFDRARSRLFAVLVELATPHVKHYLSDLYHDAAWVREFEPTPDGTTFTYVVREMGTHIYDTDDPAWSFAHADYWRNHDADAVAMYHVHVYRDRWQWTATVTPVFVRGGAA